ncbi:MAG: hypothetical protein ACD_79C00111G0002 [uncultured bacterium]|nr:MAG: hypothetical protein ACD_79C00111G0002 [uncultured bacterium]
MFVSINVHSGNDGENLLQELSKYFGKYENEDNLKSDDTISIGRIIDNKIPLLQICFNKGGVIIFAENINKSWKKNKNFIETIWTKQDFDGKKLSYKKASKIFGFYKVHYKLEIDFSQYPIITVNDNGTKGKYKFFKEKPFQPFEIKKSNGTFKAFSDNPITIG